MTHLLRDGRIRLVMRLQVVQMLAELPELA